METVMSHDTLSGPHYRRGATGGYRLWLGDAWLPVRAQPGYGLAERFPID
jgi:hypothetical protein